MKQLTEQLKTEGFCLLRLCAELKEFVQSGRTKKTYLRETEGLLDYIIKSLESVENFVRNLIVQPPEEDLVKSRLRDFGQIRKALSWLYVRTKEAVDSDSLSIPFSLATFLNQTGKNLLQTNDVSLGVCPSNQFKKQLFVAL